MRYSVRHHLRYRYSQPVILEPHTLRLRPRVDCTQQLEAFALEVDPQPQRLLTSQDLDGNDILQAHFAKTATQHLNIRVEFTVQTLRDNPFDYLLHPWAVQIPLNYPALLLARLQPYLASSLLPLDPIAQQLAQETLVATQGDLSQFLTQLTQTIYTTCQQLVRDTGDAWPAGFTWSKQAGSCRDLTVLFVEACRAVGLAARFVSGYQEGDPDSGDRHLHAWAEVYLPGAGWRGFDPTHGLAVSDSHIALVASPHPKQAEPCPGSFRGVDGTPLMGTVETAFEYDLTLQRL